MSDYTITVDRLLSINFDFGLDKYEIFDEKYRDILNNSIIEYYRFHEIGFETPTMWRNRLQLRMSMIMRNKYNDLYKSKAIEFNPLYNVDLTETYEHTIDTTGTGNNTINETNSNNIDNTSNLTNTSNGSNNTTSDNNSLTLTSSFPSEEMTEDDFSDNVYVDSGAKNTGNTNENTTTNQTDNQTQTDITETNATRNATSADTTQNKTIESYTRTNIGSSAGLPFSRAMLQLKEFYDNYDLDQQVINELQDLFMSCW